MPSSIARPTSARRSSSTSTFITPATLNATACSSGSTSSQVKPGRSPLAPKNARTSGGGPGRKA